MQPSPQTLKANTHHHPSPSPPLHSLFNPSSFLVEPKNQILGRPKTLPPFTVSRFPDRWWVAMGFEENEGVAEKSRAVAEGEGEVNERIDRQMSETSLYATEEDEEDVEGKAESAIDLGPQVSLKDQLEKDKDDESLRRWKEQLLGSVDLNSVGETLEPDVKILSLSIISPGRDDIVLPIPVVPNSKGVWFTLKEGSSYRLKFSFSVSNNIVSGLKYTNTVWKTGVKVDSAKEMVGTFSPQLEPYTYEANEETTPSGIFARGSYAARTKFVDDDGKCYLEINYTFDIRKDWAHEN